MLYRRPLRSQTHGIHNVNAMKQPHSPAVVGNSSSLIDQHCSGLRMIVRPKHYLFTSMAVAVLCESTFVEVHSVNNEVP